MKLKNGNTVLALLVLSSLATPVFAIAPSWWGGEIQAAQAGFGYGRYEATLIPGTGVGSITGFFNLCYTNDYQNCISYNPNDINHFETDVEFTPTGNENRIRRWISSTCLSSSDCRIFRPSPWPRDNNKSLLAASFNTFPHNNQLYSQMNPYTAYHTYTFVNLPNEVYWMIDDKKILNRTPNGQPLPRNYPNYNKFKNILYNKQAKLIINLWDGSQGRSGGFGGPASVIQTEGQPAQIQRVAYYPAMCDLIGNCRISDTPSFLSDFKAGKFIRDGVNLVIQEGNDICSSQNRVNPNTLWFSIMRNAYPVYVAPSHVNCKYTKNGSITLRYTSTPQ